MSPWAWCCYCLKTKPITGGIHLPERSSSVSLSTHHPGNPAQTIHLTRGSHDPASSSNGRHIWYKVHQHRQLSLNSAHEHQELVLHPTNHLPIQHTSHIWNWVKRWIFPPIQIPIFCFLSAPSSELNSLLSVWKRQPTSANWLVLVVAAYATELGLTIYLEVLCCHLVHQGYKWLWKK